MRAVKLCSNKVLQFWTGHWHCQLWGAGTYALSTYNNLIFSVHSDLSANSYGYLPAFLEQQSSPPSARTRTCSHQVLATPVELGDGVFANIGCPVNDHEVAVCALLSPLSQLQPFYDPLSGTTQVSRYQKDNPFWILLKQTQWGGSGISWTICKLFALCSRR